MAPQVKNSPAVQETQEMHSQSLGWEDPLEVEMATHSSILAWKIPWTEEPGRRQSKGSQKSRTQLSNYACTHACAIYKVLYMIPSIFTTIITIILITIFLLLLLLLELLHIIMSLFLCAYLCLILYDPLDSNPPGSPVLGISQARIPEWVAISSSRGSSQPMDQTHVSWSSCIAGEFFTHRAIIWASPRCYYIIIKVMNIMQYYYYWSLLCACS